MHGVVSLSSDSCGSAVNASCVSLHAIQTALQRFPAKCTTGRASSSTVTRSQPPTPVRPQRRRYRLRGHLHRAHDPRSLGGDICRWTRYPPPAKPAGWISKVSAMWGLRLQHDFQEPYDDQDRQSWRLILGVEFLTFTAVRRNLRHLLSLWTFFDIMWVFSLFIRLRRFNVKCVWLVHSRL